MARWFGDVKYENSTKAMFWIFVSATGLLGVLFFTTKMGWFTVDPRWMYVLLAIAVIALIIFLSLFWLNPGSPSTSGGGASVTLTPSTPSARVFNSSGFF